jgi:hypothetical protein
MSRLRLAWRCANVILLCLALSGCFPAGDGPMDEEKEPHFLTGRNRASARDFDGAIESFEKALEVNPHSASAHFELGWLYEKTGDDAAAIYHYERFLRYRPNSDKADLARSHINSCKTELAKTVSAFGPLPQAAQRDLERVMLENRDLRAQLGQWQAFYATNHPQAPTNLPVVMPVVAHDPPVQPTRPVTLQAARSETQRPNPTPSSLGSAMASRPFSAVSSRSYTVKAGDVPSAIARHCGVSVAALLAANPQVRPTHMHPGQVLNVPSL